MENVGIFCGHLEYFTAIWHSILPFGKVFSHWVYLSRFGTFRQEKSGNPGKSFGKGSVATGTKNCAKNKVSLSGDQCYDLQKYFRRKNILLN
jgi:hypothetical protein